MSTANDPANPQTEAQEGELRPLEKYNPESDAHWDAVERSGRLYLSQSALIYALVQRESELREAIAARVRAEAERDEAIKLAESILEIKRGRTFTNIEDALSMTRECIGEEAWDIATKVERELAVLRKGGA